MRGSRRARSPARATTSSWRSSRRSCFASISISTPTRACATSIARSASRCRRRDFALDMKLGPGGIREIEFIVQALQIVRGGREPALRARGTQAALDAIAARGLLPDAAVATCCAPPTCSSATSSTGCNIATIGKRSESRPTGRARGARAARRGYPQCRRFRGGARRASRGGERAIRRRLRRRRPSPPRQRRQRDDHAADDARCRRRARPICPRWRRSGAAMRMPISARDALAQAGFDDPADLVAELARLRASNRYVALPALSQQRVDELVPRLLQVAAIERSESASAQTVFKRLFGLLEAISRRSAYLALLIEHPPVSAPARAADGRIELGRRLPDAASAAAGRAARCARPACRCRIGTPGATSCARLMRDHERRRGAAARRAAPFPARAIVSAPRPGSRRTADRRAPRRSFVGAGRRRHRGDARRRLERDGRDSDDAPPKFAVVGYGKLGGKELGYASDLDLVFLHDDPDEIGHRALCEARAKAHHVAHRDRRPRERSTTSTFVCARTASPASWCPRSRRSGATSASTRGRGSTRR